MAACAAQGAGAAGVQREGLRELVAAARTEAAQERLSAAPPLQVREAPVHAQAQVSLHVHARGVSCSADRLHSPAPMSLQGAAASRACSIRSIVLMPWLSGPSLLRKPSWERAWERAQLMCAAVGLQERHADAGHAAQDTAAAGPCSSSGSMCAEGTGQEPCSQLGLDGSIAQADALMAANRGAAHTGADGLALPETPAHELENMVSDHESQPVLPDVQTADVSSCEACSLQPPPQHPSALCTQERALFDMSPEWQRALQSLAAVPGLNVFAKRLRQCNAQ